METDATLLLDLYRGARVLPPRAFPEFSLNLLKSRVPFDSARATTVELQDGATLVRGALLHNEPTDMVLDWATISGADMVLRHTMAHLGQAVNFHASSLYAQPRHAVMLDYAVRYEHRNGIVVIEHHQNSPYYHGLSLYRADEDAHFSEAERLAVQALAPHFQEALRISGAMADPAAPAEERDDLAIAGQDGRLHYCGAGFARLLSLEWPDWPARSLPAPLLAALRRTGAGGYDGRAVHVTVQPREHWLFLRARRQVRLPQLSPRELEVARWYGSGLSSKEIARKLELAPATVRNFIQKIYQKLDVRDKAQLATLMSAGRRRLPRQQAPAAERQP